jgi:hypothetical protein
MADAATPATEMHGWVCEMVQARRHEGADRATHTTARDLGISQSRVVEILKGRVGRVWADEFLAAKARYARFCERQAEAFDQQADAARAKHAAIQEMRHAGLDGVGDLGSGGSHG